MRKSLLKNPASTEQISLKICPFDQQITFPSETRETSFCQIPDSQMNFQVGDFADIYPIRRLERAMVVDGDGDIPLHRQAFYNLKSTLEQCHASRDSDMALPGSS